jgi:hypothetical protein
MPPAEQVAPREGCQVEMAAPGVDGAQHGAEQHVAAPRHQREQRPGVRGEIGGHGRRQERPVGPPHQRPGGDHRRPQHGRGHRVPARRARDHHQRLQTDQGDGEALQHVHHQKAPPALVAHARQQAQPVHRKVQAVADQQEQPEAAEAPPHRRTRHQMRRPVPHGGNGEDEPRQQQEEARGEPAVERPHPVQRAGARLRHEHRVDGVPLNHHQHGDEPREIDEQRPRAGARARDGGRIDWGRRRRHLSSLV